MINTGDTAWLLISAALVLLMTPGIAFFYSGLISSRNVINTINMVFICLGLIPLLWTVLGFTLAFAPGNGFIGGLEWAGLHKITLGHPTNVPQYAYVVFQMMFAVISPALISGAIVGRMKFKAYMLFIGLWSLLIYSPIAHWVWGPDGWIAKLGAIDFAGGTVVHINAGFAALAAAIVLGPRIAGQAKQEIPHNIPFVILGASLLWFGWYGFNAGSALSASDLAALAFVNTTLATAAAIFTWTILGWLRSRPSSAVGKACATVIGLVAITPAAGYVTPLGSIVIGCLATVICYFAMAYKEFLLRRIDDTLDVFICHGISGVCGALMTGILATKTVNPAGADGLFYNHSFELLAKQSIAIVATILMTMIGTTIILLIMKTFIHISPKPEEVIEGIDVTEHGESAYQNLT